MAVAAQLLTHQQHQEILHLDTSPDIYSQPITITLPINCLLTLGFILHMDTATEQSLLKAVRRVHFATASPDGGRHFANRWFSPSIPLGFDLVLT
jgi:hypothetical protein